MHSIFSLLDRIDHQSGTMILRKTPKMAHLLGRYGWRVISLTKVHGCRSLSLLSNKQLEAYHNDGFVVPNYKLSEDKLSKAQQALTRLLEDNPRITPELLVNSHLEDSDSAAEGVRGNKFFLEIASSVGIVDIVSQCLGTENVILWGCQIFCKPPHVGKSVPYHQDGPYWPIKPLRAVSAWIALDDSNEATGNVNFIKGSHKCGMIDHVEQADEDACISYVADPIVVDQLVGASSDMIVSVELKAGEISIHDSLVVHGSGVNKSEHRRAGIAATFMAAESHFDRHSPTEGALKGGIHLDFGKRPLFVVKGSNANNQNDQIIKLS